MDPGTGIAVAQVAFFAACKAVEAFGTALKYFDDAEALAVALEMERLRLQTWGANSGLVDGDLPTHLTIVGDLLLRQLNIISGMFADADKLRQRYGVQASIDGESEVTAVSRSSFVSRMRRSLRSSGVRLPDTAEDSDTDSLAVANKGNSASRDVSKRIRWAIRDRDQLKQLVVDLRGEIDRLNKLLTETQRRRSVHDHERISIVVVGSAVDEQSLALIRAAVDVDRDQDTLAMLDRKLLSGNDTLGTPAPAPAVARGIMSLSQYDVPENYGSLARFLAPRRDDPDSVFLFERKVFDPSIDHTSKMVLFARVQRLISLLALPKVSSFKVPRAEGYVHDPDNYCWWLIFRFSARDSSSASPADQEPVSLLRLLQPSRDPRPPLEERLALARDICSTFHQLYSSSWMHKSIRSDNILFPPGGPGSGALISPLVCGFEYSRLETETQTVDRAKTQNNASTAMYRHPDYQGEAAQGYKAQYDFYSLGLVLLEIGLWSPLISLFDSRSARPSANHRPLPKDLRHFHRPEAKELQERVLYTVDKDLPFRMGSVYAEAARWCLTYDNAPADFDSFSSPALDFYNRVVEPLVTLGGAYGRQDV